MGSLARQQRRRAQKLDRYPTNPPSASSTRQPVIRQSVFDQDRLMRALKAGLIEGIGPMDHPSDELLIATVVALGCPRWSADQMRHNPALRLAFYGMWVMVQEAAKGDPTARETVEIARQTWAESRAIGLVEDRPDMSIGLWER